nr:DNA excision repair protein ERCC-1 [Ipomoea batatas]
MESKEREEQQPAGEGAAGKKKSFVINIPSYQEVMETSQTKTVPSSLFNPTTSFSQAFNFVKDSEFYSQPPPPSSSASAPPESQTAAPRPIIQSEAPSSSATRPSSSSTAVPPPRNAILVSHRQKGNPVLKHIRNVRWVFADVVSDYLLGQNACALYLSLRYHLLHPDYLYFRIRELQKNFRLRVVLCHVDVEDVVKPLLEVTRTALLHDCTLLCAWSLEECARYLETIKVYENKPADLIQGQMDTDYLSRLNHALTSIRHVNKTDVVTLGSTFGSLSNIMDASMEDLARCPGIGERKVKRLYDTFHEPFQREVSKHAVSEAAANENTGTSPAPESEEIETAVKDPNKRRKNEPDITIKSALSAAFAKYSHKVGRKTDKSQQEKAEGEENNTNPEANSEP